MAEQRLIDANKLHYIKVMILHQTKEEATGKQDVVVFAKEIDKAPTVDAVPVVHGHWVGLCGEHILPDSNGKVGPEGCICSCCGEYLIGSDEYIVNGKFCPSCGVKMDKEVDEQDDKD